MEERSSAAPVASAKSAVHSDDLLQQLLQTVNHLALEVTNLKESRKASHSPLETQDRNLSGDNNKFLKTENLHEYANFSGYKMQDQEPRRQTIFGDAPSAPTYIKYAPPTDHIKLTSTSLGECFKFYYDVKEFISSHKLEFPVGLRIAKSIRMVLGTNCRPSVSQDVLMQWPSQRVLEAVQLYNLPSEQHVFRTSLRELTRLHKWNRYNFRDRVPDISQAQKFCQDVLAFMALFKDAFNFISINNSENTPTLSRKSGVLQIFAQAIPTEIATNILKELPEHYESVDDFISHFSRKFNNYMDTLKNAAFVLRLFNDTQREDSHEVQPSSNFKSSGSNFQQPRQYPNHRLQSIDTAVNSSAFSDESVFPTYDDTILDSSDLQEILNPTLDDDNDFDEDFSPSLAALQNSSAPPQVNRGIVKRPPLKLTPEPPAQKKACLTALLQSSCNKRDCPYEHAPRDMLALCKEVVAKIKQSKYYSMLPKDSQFNGLFSALLKQSPSMKTQCCLLTSPNDLTITALFDTGASANFVSEQFLELHPEIKKSLRPCNFSVTLGDASVRTLDKSLFLNLQFGDSVVSAHFHVIPHKHNDVIIGLPLICSELKSTFLDLLHSNDSDCAMLETHPSPAVNTISANSELLPPWSHALLPAPEEDEAPSPVSFRIPTNFLGVPYETVFEEYVSLFDAHINPDFRDQTDIVAHLRDKWSKVFVPTTWSGISGIPPVTIALKPGFPDKLKPPARPINPNLFQVAKTEFERMKKYFYVPSAGPIASPLVIAPKATKPFVRICGDYTPINKFMLVNHATIPHVRHSLDKIQRFKVFFDLDMSNSFHQFPLSDEASNLLSVQTPFGQYRPLFMPEGISIASGVLQSTMQSIFSDFDDFMIVIFDNMLVLADDFSDGMRKLDLVFQRCLDRNICLKMSKSFLGFSTVNFFGYVCTPQSYTLSEEKKKAIMEVPIPKTLKALQSFLGTILFFAPFVPNFSSLAAPLYDYTKNKTFDAEVFKSQCSNCIDTIKKAMINCLSIHYPDYSLDWILRTDASQVGIGGVLYQIVPSKELQPIAVVSKKFSEQATKWSTIEQEAFGIFYSVKQLAYYLRCKFFVLETDHRNLLFMEQSLVPKIIRWRAYLQSFNFLLRHIPGRTNIAADYYSKAFNAIDTNLEFESDALLTVESDISTFQSAEDYVFAVHNSKWGHSGVTRTYARLNKSFPGHGISIKQLSDILAQCPTCQKTRIGNIDFSIEPIYRHLKVQHLHAAIGVDMLSITPADVHGNEVAIVIVVFFSKLVYIYPAKDYTANTLATALFKFFCQYGIFEEIHSDPGSNLTSEAINQLNAWFGIKHVISLVDVHSSCGVERTNQEILRHLRALVCDDRIKDKWSDDKVLPLVSYLINSEINAETGSTPFELHFGSSAQKFHRAPPELSSIDLTAAILKELNENLSTLREASSVYQADLILQRSTRKLHVFCVGDFVLKINSHPAAKLEPKFLGPYEVMSQYKNDIECKHVVDGDIKKFHISMLKPFFGSKEDAIRIAKMDKDQYVVTAITAYLGDPLCRNTMLFEVHFEDSSTSWLPFSEDLFMCVAYEDYCRSLPQLFPLVLRNVDSKQDIARLNKEPITEVKLGDAVFILLRSLGEVWYSFLPIPDVAHINYVFKAIVEKFADRAHTKVKIFIPVFKEVRTLTHSNIFMYPGLTRPDNCVVIDAAFIKQFPCVAERS